MFDLAGMDALERQRKQWYTLVTREQPWAGENGPLV